MTSHPQVATPVGCRAAAPSATSLLAVNSRLVTRFAPWRVLRVGAAGMLAAGAALSAVAGSGTLTPPVAIGLLEVFFIGLGLLAPNATALAFDRVPHAPGTGSSVLGALHTALVAPLIGLGGTATALPMLLGMTGCAGLAGLALCLTRSTPPRSPR